MNIELTARHTDLTPEIRAYAEDKVGKLERLLTNPSIHLTISSEKHRFKVSLIAINRGNNIAADVEDSDLQKAIGEAVDAVARQVRKEKTSRLADRREGAETIRRPASDGVPAPMQVDKEMP